jgi:hypothetical protein
MQTTLTSNLPITFNYGAFGLHLGLEQLKDRTIKLSTVSNSLINLHSGVFVDFQNKTQRFLCMTLSSLSYVVFMDPFQGNDGVLPSLFHSEYVIFLE